MLNTQILEQRAQKRIRDAERLKLQRDIQQAVLEDQKEVERIKIRNQVGDLAKLPIVHLLQVLNSLI